MSEPLLEITGLEKDYHTLRPLRVRQLTVRPGDVFSISGIDMLGAETFVHLVTGATLPDCRRRHPVRPQHPRASPTARPG